MMANDEKQQGYPTKTGLRGGENNVSKNVIVSPNWGVDWSGFGQMKNIDKQNKQGGYQLNGVGGGTGSTNDGSGTTNFTE